MEKILLRLQERTCPIYFSRGRKGFLREVLEKSFASSRWIVVTHPRIQKLYGPWLKSEVGSLGKIETLLIPEGEKYKTLQTVEKIYKQLSGLKVDRHTPLIALGGGVVGDVAGFAAATYLRGIPLVQIPTTLLAQVDSSVGGKTGVDLPTGKNLVGAFYQPHLVFIDVSTLKTLPRREILCGSAEVIKYGIIQSPSLFSLLEKNIQSFLNLDFSLLQKVIQECVQIKAHVVEKDEKETTGLRMILNFGHTLAHAIETLSGYKKFNHGEAVAMGMAFATGVSHQMKRVSDETVERVLSLLRDAGFPDFFPPFSRKAYLQVMAHDKKAKNGNIRYVLLRQIGKVEVKELSLEKIGNFLDSVKRRGYGF